MCLVTPFGGMAATLFLLPVVPLHLIYVIASHQVHDFNRLLATVHENVQRV